MTTSRQIEQMSCEEKLQAMKALWTDLSRVDAEIDSPSWPETVLSQTEARVAACQEQLIDGGTAKQELRKRRA